MTEINADKLIAISIPPIGLKSIGRIPLNKDGTFSIIISLREGPDIYVDAEVYDKHLYIGREIPVDGENCVITKVNKADRVIEITLKKEQNHDK